MTETNDVHSADGSVGHGDASLAGGGSDKGSGKGSGRALGGVSVASSGSAGRPSAHRDLPTLARPRFALALILAHDALVGAAAMYFSVRARYSLAAERALDAGEVSTQQALAAAQTDVTLWAPLLFAMTVLAVFPILGVHRGVWRFTALPDLWRLVQAVTLATLLFVPVIFLRDRADGFPRVSLLTHLPLACLLLAMPRVVTALAAGGGWRALFRDEDMSRPPAILLGGAVALDEFLRSHEGRRNGMPFRVRALVTLDARHSGRSIRGRRVVGDTSMLGRAIHHLQASDGTAPDVVLIEAPPTRDELNSILKIATRAGADVVRPTRKTGRNSLTHLDAADLLNRPARRLDRDRVHNMIAGKRVLVTGAGGTIGSELTRQVVKLSPAHLTLLDASEYNLYDIDMELREMGWTADAALGDVRDARRVRDIMTRAMPDVVLHAAALKHVPLMEQNPHEAFLTNVLGTINVADAARDAGVGVFVLISTDKAVQPTNIMGASKRIAELFVQATDAVEPDMAARAVRFGNVLGSTGSVVPLFEKQIARGGPITVTDPEITRYFMTVSEAASLVLQAAALSDTSASQGGGVYVLDMGEPVRIEDLAKQLCRLRGLEPGVDIEITHTGLRPGEKLHEEIFYPAETVGDTIADGVMSAVAQMIPMAELRPNLETLVSSAQRRDRAGTFSALQTILPDYRRGSGTAPSGAVANGGGANSDRGGLGPGGAAARSTQASSVSRGDRPKDGRASSNGAVRKDTAENG